MPRAAAAAFAPPAPRATARAARPATKKRAPAAAGGENLPLGVVAGLAAAAVGAALWAGITVLTNFQIGWMAVGVGALVGVAVRTLGKGTRAVFGVMGALLSLGGCLVGNFLAGAIVLSRHGDVSLVTFLTRVTPALASRLMTVMFSPMDLLFYALAIWQGYKLSVVRRG